MKAWTTLGLIKLIFFFLIFPQFGLLAEAPTNEKTRTIEKSFTATSLTNLNVENRRGDINIFNTNESEGKVEIIVTARSKNEEELDKLIQKFDLEVKEHGNNVEINGSDNIKSWVKINTFIKNSNIITFKDGTKIKGIEEIDVFMNLYLPKISSLKAKNKYHDILFENLDYDFEADLYSGKLKGADINGRFDLEMKYGEVEIGSFKDGDIIIYDSEFSSAQAGCVHFGSKYSNIVMKDLESLEMVSYEDEIELGDIAKEIEFDSKYSDLKMGSFSEGEFDLYDTDVEGKNGNTLEIKSKYGTQEFDELGATTLTLYEDGFEAVMVKDLMVKGSKYSNIFIKTFKGEMNIRSSYEDEISVANMIKEFDGLFIEAKYTDLSLPIPTSISYLMESEIKYGELEYADQFESTNRDRDGSELKLKGVANGGDENSPKVVIKAYDSEIDITY